MFVMGADGVLTKAVFMATKRTTKACLECRRRKVKCIMPMGMSETHMCARCVRSGAICVKGSPGGEAVQIWKRDANVSNNRGDGELYKKGVARGLESALGGNLTSSHGGGGGVCATSLSSPRPVRPKNKTRPRAMTYPGGVEYNANLDLSAPIMPTEDHLLHG